MNYYRSQWATRYSDADFLIGPIDDAIAKKRKQIADEAKQFDEEDEEILRILSSLDNGSPTQEQNQISSPLPPRPMVNSNNESSPSIEILTSTPSPSIEILTSTPPRKKKKNTYDEQNDWKEVVKQFKSTYKIPYSIWQQVLKKVKQIKHVQPKKKITCQDLIAITEKIQKKLHNDKQEND